MSHSTKAFSTFASLAVITGLGVTLAGPAAAATGTPTIAASCAGVTASISGNSGAVGITVVVGDKGEGGGGTGPGSITVPVPQDSTQYNWTAEIFSFGKANSNGASGGTEKVVIRSAKGTVGPCLVTPPKSGDGTSAASPIVVGNPRDVPADAIQDPISTFSTEAKCDSTRSWVLTQAAVEEASHQEYKFKKVIPGSAAVTHNETRYNHVVPAVSEQSHMEWTVEQRTREFVKGTPAQEAVTSPRWGVDQRTRSVIPAVPATAEVSHMEYGSQERTREFKPGHAEVSHMEYGSQERTREFKPGTPAQDAVTHQEYKYQRSVDQFKTEDRYMYRKYVSGNIETLVNGKWVVNGTFSSELYAPSNGWGGSWNAPGAWGDTRMVNESGSHNSYSNGTTTRKHSTAYTHTRAELIDTRQVKTGTTTETSGWLLGSPGADWTKIDTRTVVDKAAVPATPDSYSDWSAWMTKSSGLANPPVLKSNTSTREYRQLTPVKVVDSPAVADAYSDWSEWMTKASGLTQPPVLKSNTNTHEFRQLTPVKVVDKEATPGTPAGFTAWSDWKSIATDLKVDPTNTLDRNTTVQEKRVVKEADHIDKEAVPAVPDSYTDWSDWKVIAKNLLTDPTNTLDRNTKLQEKRVPAPTTVVDVEAEAGYTEYYNTDQKEPSLNEADASYVAGNPDAGFWTPFGDVKVVTDQEAVPAKTVYYVDGADPSTNEADASWVKASPGNEWTQFDERKVIDVAAVPGKKTFYGYSDNVACNTSTYIDTTPPTIPVPPVKPPVVVPPVVTPPVVVVPPVVVKPVVVVTPPATIYTENNTVNYGRPSLVAPGLGAPHTGGAGVPVAARQYDRLPTTGDNTGAIAAMGAVLLGAGAALRFGRRRRSNQS